MLKDLRDYFLIKKSGYFDLKYYLLHNPDIRKSDVNPLLHYVRYGWQEGRYPSREWKTILDGGPAQNTQSSMDNPLIEFIKRNNVEKRSFGRDIITTIVFFYRFITQFWKLKSIVFYGGYPYPERERDGYYQRIRSIDSIFRDRRRIYVDNVRLLGRDFWYDIPEPGVLVFRPLGRGLQRIVCELFIRICILRSKIVYFQSILSTAGKEFFWANPKIIKVVDVHGAVPEEFKLQGDESKSEYFGNVERVVLERANYVVVVSEAMRNHLENKYSGNIRGEFITIPNIRLIEAAALTKPYVDGKPVLIYAGGVHVWQQIQKIIDTMLLSKSFYVYKIFSPHPEQVVALLPKGFLPHGQFTLGSVDKEEIIRELRTSHYGFILREDKIVNQVSCPTKLVEYLATGVIPILDSPNIGDFLLQGMQYTNLEAVRKNQLPPESIRTPMAEQNYSIYTKLLDQYKLGMTTLQSIEPGAG